MERLLHVSAALGAEARRRERSVGGLLEELLEQNDDGSLSDRCVQGLRERERELAAARDYRSAAAVCDLLEVLGTPQQRAPLTLADAPASLEEQIPFFFAHGFCVVADLAEGDELARLQDAWMRAEHPERERWDAARAEVLIERGVDAAAADASTPVSHFKGAEGSGRLLPNGTAPYDNGVSYPQSTFDVGNLLSKDDAFLDLADHPRLLPLLSEVCGASGLTTGASAESPYHGIVRCGGMSGRVVPSGEANEQGYLSWHRDKPPADGWPLPNYRLVKVFVAIFDIPADGGGTGVVPGSHRLTGQPREVLSRSYGGGATVGELSHYQMPNLIECSVKAGSAVAFDSSIWHTSFPNVSGVDRRTTLTGYRSSQSANNAAGGWPRGPGEARAGLTLEVLQRLDGEGKLPVTRRALLGLPLEGRPE